MQKILSIGLVLTLLLSTSVHGQSRLKTAGSAKISAGFVTESVVLADSASQLFLEFIKDDRVAKSLDGQVYDGEILPPVRIDNQYKAPRARMRELLSFEVISDSNEALELIDQFAAMQSKTRLRTSFGNQAGNRSQGAQLITLFATDTNVSDPALWKYNPDNVRSPWKRLGGILAETPIESEKIFSAFLFGTGVYTIWDENPRPDFEVTFQNDEIEFAEPSPFPSVIEEELSTLEDSEFVELLEGEEAFFEDDFNTTTPRLPGDDSAPELVPAVGSANEQDSMLIPAVAENDTQNTQAAPMTPTTSSTTNSGFLLAPASSNNALVPASPNTDSNAAASNEVSLSQALQANSFQDFGTNNGDLPVAGSFQFPWLILIVFAILGFSVYAIRKKPY